jgi:hypothetical protein
MVLIQPRLRPFHCIFHEIHPLSKSLAALWSLQSGLAGIGREQSHVDQGAQSCRGGYCYCCCVILSVIHLVEKWGLMDDDDLLLLLREAMSGC